LAEVVAEPQTIEGARRMGQIDLIYNMTAVCPHDCANCCVDAVHVRRDGDIVKVRSDGLTSETLLPRPDRNVPIYDLASRHLQERGLELDLASKLRLVNNIDVANARLDISGGDPLCVMENLEVLRAASVQLGRSNVTLTATGAGLASHDLGEIGRLIGEYNFTFDSASIDDVAHRPKQYATRNFKVAKIFAAGGSITRAEFPITRSTSNPDHLRRLYELLHEARISKLLLMRLFPVGRGETVAHDILKAEEYRAAIGILRTLEARFGTPVLRLQCALRHFEARTHATSPSPTMNPCDMVHESFGVTPDGTVLMSPWAINRHGRPLHPTFVLGNLAQQKLSQILASPKVGDVRRRADENFGHCKIFTFLHSAKADPLDRLFDPVDPLYLAPTASAAAA
jgi:MoaA/NifB/PqqE/SkfB family radical SAM enzyme